MEQEHISPATPKQNLRASQILCYALLVGCVVFVAIIILLIETQGPVIPDRDKYYNIFLSINVVIAIFCVAFAVRGYNKRIAGAKNLTASLNDKLNHYRSILILYMAPCEGAALFSVIIFFLTGNYYSLCMVLVMLGAMLSRFPFKAKAIKELELDWKEQQELL